MGRKKIQRDPQLVEKRVKLVRQACRALSAFMTSEEIASHIGVGVDTLRQYATVPSSKAHRYIPDDRLKMLQELMIQSLKKALKIMTADQLLEKEDIDEAA